MPAFIEFLDDPASPGIARNRIVVLAQQDRRIVASGAYAVEYALHRAGRLTNRTGEPLSDKEFIQIAIAGNAAMDKQMFFNGAFEKPNGCWPPEMDETFMNFGAALANTLPMECVFAIAEAMINERRLDCQRLIEIATPYLPGAASKWTCG